MWFTSQRPLGSGRIGPGAVSGFWVDWVSVGSSSEAEQQM
jgi:hypothetical protein